MSIYDLVFACLFLSLESQELFLREVLPYRVADEPVDAWRESFFAVLAPHAKKATSLRAAVEDQCSPEPASYAQDVVPRIFTELRASPEAASPAAKGDVQGLKVAKGLERHGVLDVRESRA